MKKFFIMLTIGVVVFVGYTVLNPATKYNEMVDRQETVNEKWAQVVVQYQRRADLIPNVEATVKGMADYEQNTLNAVVTARSAAAGMAPPADVFTDPAAYKRWEEAQSNITRHVSSLLVSFERYPNLTAGAGFQTLIVELEGTENRIAVARRNFNESVRDYNAYIRKFPQMMYAGLLGFDKFEYFEGDNGIESAPKVNFE